MSVSLELRVLGPVEVVHDGAARRIGSPLQRALLALLLTRPNEVVTTDRIVDALWPENPPDARRKLWFHVSKLRGILQPGGADGSTDAILATLPTGYAIRIEPDRLDSSRFERLARSGRATLEDDAARAAELLRQALDLWRGEPFEDVLSEDAVSSEVARLNELRLVALEDRFEADLALGRAGELIPELEALVTEQPFRENLRVHLMLALYRAGRQADALAAYRRARQTLVEGLGIEPSDELTELHRRILEHDPVLARPLPPTRGGGPREERKVVTVFLAELVDPKAKAKPLDPEDVRAFLSPYHARIRSELERFGGTVEKVFGNAVMAIFGVPAAHEDDPERAVRAALAIRRWLMDEGEAMQARFGVASGDALVALPASAEEPVAVGEVVKHAARLRNAAPVNTVLVDRQTFRRTKDAVEYREAAAIEAEGTSEPINAWEPVRPLARPRADLSRHRTPFVGRERELATLQERLDWACSQRSPQLVTILGVPGIGKTRLVAELQQALGGSEDALTWRQGRSLPYGDGISFWALEEIVKGEAGILEGDPTHRVERKLGEAVRRIVEDPAEARRIATFLGALVGLGGSVAAAADRRGETFAAWRQFLEALADQRPLVLVFEDLHWADHDLLDFVDHLVDWTSGVPMLVVCTARPELLERRPGWGGGKPNALTLSLSPLSDEETAQLVAALLERSVLAADRHRILLERAGGNPLYAEQFARLLAESGAAADPPLPETVQGIIAARLDGLPAEEKQLLQDAAVLGKVFWRGAACTVAGLDEAEAERQLNALQRKEFVRRERRSSVGGEDEYTFRHLLVRDVAYDQIPRSDRADRHERAAQWIESLGRSEDHADMLAHHYLEALRLRQAAGRDEHAELIRRARLAARDAGERAFALGAFPAAARLFESALELWPSDDEERPELLLAYARSRVDDVALDDAVLEQATEGLLRSGQVEAAAEAQARLGGVWLKRGDRDRAFAHIERARDLAGDRGPSPTKAFVLQELGRFLMMTDDFEGAIELSTESLRLAEIFGLDAIRARSLNTIGCARVSFGDRGGLEDLERSIEIGAAANSYAEVTAAQNLEWMVVLLGDMRRAWELHESARARSRRVGVVSYIRWLEAEHVIRCYWIGRWDESLATMDAYLDEIAALPSHYMEGNCRSVRAAIWLARARAEDALAEAHRATELARPVKDPQSLNPTLAFEARVALALGDRATAEALADELVGAWHATGIRQPDECTHAAWLFADLGRVAELRQALKEARAFMAWHEAAWCIASDDPAGAAEVYAQIGSVPDEAYARLQAAKKCAGAGDRFEADRQLRLAEPAFAELGATAWAAEAEELLAQQPSR